MPAQRNPGYRYAVLLVDIDRFGEFNDSLGPVQGDQIITKIGQRLATSLRPNDTVARPRGDLPVNAAVLSRRGGDEVTILLDEIKDSSDTLRVAERIQAAVAAPLLAEGGSVLVSASIGIALNTTPHERAEDLLRDADFAMRRAKSLGGSRREVFSEALHNQAVHRLRLETELRNALEQKQFLICYQPIVHLESRQVTGFEALVRWQHPTQGVIPPSRFIEVAESIGLTVSLGKWVIHEACQQITIWQSKFHSPIPLGVTVNLSPRQLAHVNLVADVRTALQETRIEPSRLQLEITENVAMADSRLTSDVLARFRHLGVRSSIGDFGTGCSSLPWLR